MTTEISNGPFGRLTSLDVKKTFPEVHNREPRFLTDTQLREWNSLGYILNVPILDAVELASARQFFEPPDDRLRSRRAGLNIHAHDPFAHDLVRHPRTLGCLSDLIGPDIVCFISQYLNKRSGALAANHGHQDCVFNAMEVGCAIVWLALEDADEFNGCMWFVPGSHKLGVLECGADYALKDVSSFTDWIPARVRAGHCVIMSDLLIHSSPANPSADRHRPGFTATYAPTRTPILQEFTAEPIHCAGVQNAPGWTFRPRPREG